MSRTASAPTPIAATPVLVSSTPPKKSQAPKEGKATEDETPETTEEPTPLDSATSDPRTFTHFGLIPAFKKETTLPLATRTAENLVILAKAMLTLETRVNSHDLVLKQRAPALPSASDSPFPRFTTSPFSAHGSAPAPIFGTISSDADALAHPLDREHTQLERDSDRGAKSGVSSPNIASEDALDARIDYVEQQLERTQNDASDLEERVAALEAQPHVTTQPNPNPLFTPEVRQAIVAQFQVITSDRDVLHGDIQFEADDRTAADGALREDISRLRVELAAERKDVATLHVRLREQVATTADLQQQLRDVRATIERLELAPPAPLLPRSRSVTAPARNVNTRSRSRSPASKRLKTANPEETLTSDSPQVIMGPFRPSPLGPVDLFLAHMTAATPRFALPTRYYVEWDPAASRDRHLLITFPSTATTRALLSAWEEQDVPGYQGIRMFSRETQREGLNVGGGGYMNHPNGRFPTNSRGGGRPSGSALGPRY
ncbi:hypothetical protein C8J57DRAFT_1458634 [Mycena rebaudengoi]|nr:hypothetical protein C8J57DRAFT_1458634 [Mycena rebaudengoi]